MGIAVKGSSWKVAKADYPFLAGPAERLVTASRVPASHDDRTIG